MNTWDGFDNSILVFSFFLLHCAPVKTRREILFRDKWLLLNSNENKTRWIIGYCTSGVNRGVMKYTSFLYFNDIKSATDAESGTCFVPVF